jgi:hypothetical protein
MRLARRYFFLAISVFFAGLVGLSSASRADVLWEISGVQFQDGGTLSGQFTVGTTYCCAIEYNDQYGNTAYSLTTTGGSILPGSSYNGPVSGFPSISPFLSDGYKVVTFYENGAGYSGILLQLTFANPLNVAGPNSIVGGIPGPSFECGIGWDCGGTTPTRYVYSDGITYAVPEPATWGMMVLGFLGLGFLGYRRRGKNSGSGFRFAS